ncbi:MAG: hypothetical protein AAFP84_19775 [Actinomycetota bacterium]
MSSIAIVGDATTTTAMALTSTWPVDADALLVEADPTGGSIAAWLDVPITPSLSSIVAAVHRTDRADRSEQPTTISTNTTGSSSPGDSAQLLDSMVRRAAGGLRFLPCPFTEREAERAVAASQQILAELIARPDVDVLVDLGAARPTALPPMLPEFDAVVVVHRQERSSPRAAAVRLERLTELIDAVDRARAIRSDTAITLAVVGDRPFDPAEIAAHLGPARVVRLATLAEDPLSAAVLAGRSGISARRLGRQPLLRSARRFASVLAGPVPRPDVAEGAHATGPDRPLIRAADRDEEAS